MALYHKATITPSKAELVAEWAPTQSWYPDSHAKPEVVGAFRFDDPNGSVGIETHLIVVDGTYFQVPVTYRNEAMANAEQAFMGQVEHSALGTRWVYDGVGDEVYLVMLAAVAMTGQGEAIGMVVYDGRWHIAPSNVRLEGGGWGMERVAVDHMKIASVDDNKTVLANDAFELTFFRQPQPAASRPPMGLTATWDALSTPMLLAQITKH